MAEVKSSEALHNEHQDNLLELQRLLTGVQDFVNGVASPTFGGVKRRMSQHLQQDLNWLAALTGNITAIEGGASTKDLLHPDREVLIFGKKLDTRNPVTSATVAPSKDDKKAFSNSVTDLYNGFLGLKDKDILNILSKPKGEALIRGVAKKAGVANWESIGSDQLDMAFFADIRTAIKENAKSKALNADTEAAIEETDKANNVVVSDETAKPVKKAATPAKAKVTKAAAKRKSGASLDDYK